MDLHNTLRDSQPIASSSTAPDPHNHQQSPRFNASRSSAVAHLTQSLEPSQSSNASASRPADDADIYPADESGNAPGNGDQPRRKRARVGTKITRNRKITSCLPCRERKQKCDRTHPVCQKCIDDRRECFYVDNESAGDAAGSQITDERQTKPYEDDNEYDEMRRGTKAGSDRAAFIQRRRQIIADTWAAGRNRHLDFESRVRAARAAAVAEVLFAENGGRDLKAYGQLKLPTRSEAQMLLQYYQTDVQEFTNILLIDLNRARIGDFLDWWHSDPITLPAEADAPLAPLVLCILALCLQAKRTRDAVAKAERGDNSNIPQDGHCISVIPSVSSERFLLETAGRCINALQIACPSSWASAYSAPLDIVRAESLRGVWHLGECHLQFASSTLNVALRLACAAGLHRDPKHWGALQMSEFEAQARRSAWWNIAYVEVFHSHRTGQPSSISADAADTELPLGFSAVAAQFKASGFPQSSVSQLSFDCLVARFYLTKLFLDHGASVFGLRRKPSQVVHDLETIYDKWEQSLPEHIVRRIKSLPELLASPPNLDTDQAEPIWQLLLLEISRLQGRISVHRPYSDFASGVATSREASRRSLRTCLDAASQLISLCLRAVTRKPSPPFLWLNIISYHTFNAGCLVAIHLVSGSESAGLCSAAYRDSLAVLDNLADKRALHNVSEQAERYAAAIREIAATPGKFHSPSSESRPVSRGSFTSQSSSSHPERQSSAAANRQGMHRPSHPHSSIPLRVGRTSPTFGQEDLAHPKSSSSSVPDDAHARGWSSDASRGQARLPSASPLQSTVSPSFGESSVTSGGPSGGLAPLPFEPSAGAASSESSVVEDFFTKHRAATSFVDRPLPGANQFNFGSLVSLLPEDLGAINPSAPPASGQSDKNGGMLAQLHRTGPRLDSPDYLHQGPSSPLRRSTDGGSTWQGEGNGGNVGGGEPFGHANSPTWRSGSHVDNSYYMPNGPSVLNPPPPHVTASFSRHRPSQDSDPHHSRSTSGGRHALDGRGFPMNSGGGPVLPPLSGHLSHANHQGGGGGAGSALPRVHHHQYASPKHHALDGSAWAGHSQPPPPPDPQMEAAGGGPAAGGLGQVDWYAWENFITKVLQDS